MQNIKLGLGIIGFVSLLAVIIATPAAAQEAPSVSCTTRTLDQGSGSVRICVQVRK